MSCKTESERNILKKDSVLRLRSFDGKAETEFTIVSVLGMGASSVCYEVTSEKGEHGRLKEFYPFESEKYALRRAGNHQLIVEESALFGEYAYADFKKDVTELAETYALLSEARNEEPALNSYIPNTELFSGIDYENDRKGTLYVWTRNPKKLVVFSDYLEQVKKDIDDERYAEQHLLHILEALLSLTKCIRALHNSELFHLDIKPDNFGLGLDDKNEVDAGNISLFDVNSLYRFGSAMPVKCIGTEGFAPKELREGRPKNKSDLYSIGATLFYALLYVNGKDVCFYGDRLYGDLAKIVSSSRLLRATDDTADTKLFDILLKILSETLHVQENRRYAALSYDGLSDDLKTAIDLLHLSVVEKKNRGLETALKLSRETHNIEESLDRHIKTGATGAIQRLLLEKPLYHYGNGAEEMHILVLGAGTYAQKFIDIAFEVSQIKGCSLSVTVVSNDKERDKKRYLSARPAFSKFFAVDGEEPSFGEAYGKLIFKSTASAEAPRRAFGKNENAENGEILEDISPKAEAERFAYVFIALGDDALNRTIAAESAASKKLLCENAQVAFVQYKKHTKSFYKQTAEATPVFVNDVITDSSDYDELRRMAFNCHILWEDKQGIDLQKAKGAFSSPYSFNSCFAHVISIRYKLHSMGIELEDHSAGSLMRAAAEVQEKLRNLETLGELSMYEHRRWIVNTVCAGWDTLTDYSTLVNATKDKKAKLHPCLVPSGSELTLSGEEWSLSNRKKWDDRKVLYENTLDALDLMSVKMHQHFSVLSKKVDTATLFDEIDDVMDSLTPYPEAQNALGAMVSALTEIIGGATQNTWIYRFYCDKFEKKLDSLPDAKKEWVQRKLKVIDAMVYPILESKKYVDYKAKDQVLVKNIPFILTYSTAIQLCVPFAAEMKGELNNRVLFGNVAAAMFLNPSAITYIADTEDFYDDPKRFEKALKYAVSIFDERKMQAKLHLVLIQNKDLPLTEETVAAFKALSPRIGNVETLEYRTDDELHERLSEFFRNNRKGSRRFHAIEKNATGISKLMRGFGCYRDYPSYALTETGDFLTENGCEYFRYVHFDGHLRVSEMFASEDLTVETQPPELPDYMDFWQMYHTSEKEDSRAGNEYAWKTLCGVLGQYARENDCLGKIELAKKQKTGDRKQYSFCMPSMCYLGVKKILSELMRLSPDTIGENTGVKYYNSGSCKVTFTAEEKTFEAFGNICKNPYYLCEPDSLQVQKRFEGGKLYAAVIFDSLLVKALPEDMLTGAFPSQRERPLQMLRTLYEKGKLVAYHHDKEAKRIRFCYASPQVKQVMTTEGRALELYVYYKALEENYFDDIVCSFSVSDADRVSNEFDLILTKGFRSLIVECKARATLDQNFYHKLAQLNLQYGIHSKAVLVADTLEKPSRAYEVNDMQRSRGAKSHVYTIYRYEDIEHIGKKLREIMEMI